MKKNGILDIQKIYKPATNRNNFKLIINQDYSQKQIILIKSIRNKKDLLFIIIQKRKC